MKKVLFILLIMLFSVNLIAVPNMMNYRGKLFETGMPVNGNRNLQFRIYNVDSGGVPLWDSGVHSLMINNGYYHYTLSNLSPSLFTNDKLYLDVNVNGSSLIPRERLDCRLAYNKYKKMEFL